MVRSSIGALWGRQEGLQGGGEEHVRGFCGGGGEDLGRPLAVLPCQGIFFQI